MSDSPASLYLLDTHALIYQMFHAVPQMTAPDGRPINAVFGVTRDLLDIVENVRPTYLLCAFDRPEPTFRNTLYPEYKAPPPPPPPPPPAPGAGAPPPPGRPHHPRPPPPPRRPPRPHAPHAP